MRLQLPYSESAQDWEWEVADPSRLAEFVAVYEREPLNIAERSSLMEIIVQCAEDLSATSHGDAAWSQVERLLRTHPEIHLATVRYWACLEAGGAAEACGVTPKMRALWATMSRGAADA